MLPFDDDIGGGVRGLYSRSQRAHTAGRLAILLHGSGDGMGKRLEQFTVRHLKIHSTDTKPVVEPRLLSPPNLVAVGSFLLTMGLVGWTVAIADGVTLIGILVMAFTTPVLCYERK